MRRGHRAAPWQTNKPSAQYQYFTTDAGARQVASSGKRFKVNPENTVNGAEKESIQEQIVNTEVRFNVINVTNLVIK